MWRVIAPGILRSARLQRTPTVVLPPAWSQGRCYAFSFSWAATRRAWAVAEPQWGEPAGEYEPTQRKTWLGGSGTDPELVATAPVSGPAAGQFPADSAGYAESAAACRGLVHLLQATGGDGQRRPDKHPRRHHPGHLQPGRTVPARRGGA